MSTKSAADKLSAFTASPNDASLARLPLVRVYCDESSTTGHRFRVWGGIWVRDSEEATLRDAVDAVRRDTGWVKRGEFKWTKLGGSTCHPAYLRLVDAFFAGRCSFAAIVVDSQNPGRNRGTDAELDHYKALYWLLSKRASARYRYQVVLDERTDRERDRLSVLRDVLNAAARRDYRSGGDIFREVIARRSHDDDLVQLADILIGAIGYHRNGRHLVAGASAAKCHAARYIGQRAGFAGGIIRHTRRAERKFNIWYWNPTT